MENVGRGRFSIARKDEEVVGLVEKSDKKTLALWAVDCAERVLPYFEKMKPGNWQYHHLLELGKNS